MSAASVAPWQTPGVVGRGTPDGVGVTVLGNRRTSVRGGRGLGPLAPAAAAALLLGGCTLGSPDEAAAPSGPAAAPDAPQGVSETVEVLLAAAGEETVDLSGELPVLATRPAESSDGGYEVDLNGVAVRGELMTVVFTVRVKTVSRSVFSVNDLFDDGRAQEGESALGPSSYSTDGVFVLDPAEGTRHLVAYDSEGRCVCSDGLTSGAGMAEGGSIVLTATMAAPPESTTSVDVVVPTVGAFTDVALER